MSENPYEQSAPAEPAVRPRHLLVLANETVAGRTLLDAIEERAAAGPIRVTVISPQNDPRAGYVVYEDSRRSSADRRLRRWHADAHAHHHGATAKRRHAVSRLERDPGLQHAGVPGAAGQLPGQRLERARC